MRCWIIKPAVLVSILGFLSTHFNWAIAQDVQGRAPAGLVEVEPLEFIPTLTQGGFDLVPYKRRREKWGGYFTLSGGNYAPTQYESDYFVDPFDEVYPTTTYNFFEASYSVKLNIPVGAITLDIGIGSLALDSLKDFEGAKLELTPARIGLTFHLDALFNEPYFVPFFGGGIYGATYKETYDGAELTGKTTVAPYFTAGVSIQLNWMDPISSRDAYADIGIENAFLVAEYRGLMAAQGELDPDYSANFLNVGFRLEH